MSELSDEVESIELEEGDVLKGVIPLKEEPHKNGPCYVFRINNKKYVDHEKIKGILFPKDEIVSIGERYDALISSIHRKNGKILLFTSIHHILMKDDLLKVQVTHIGSHGDPMFRLYKYTGIVDDRRLKKGSKALVRVTDIYSRDRTPLVKTNLIQRYEE